LQFLSLLNKKYATDIIARMQIDSSNENYLQKTILLPGIAAPLIGHAADRNLIPLAHSLFGKKQPNTPSTMSSNVPPGK
jgi:hypothetical protein